jgi:hypothetical protein
MLVVPSQSFSHHSIKHVGFTLDKVDRAIEEVTSYMPMMDEQIEKFKQIELSPIEQKSLAKVASDIRFDSDIHLVDSNDFLAVNREEDNNSTLWAVFNRVQEAMIRGGIKGINKDTKRNFTSKPITAIDTNLKLNKELFATVQMIADLKSA